MDKRKTVGSEKYNIAHKEMLLKSKQILASSNFLDLTFQNLSKSSKYSKTTIYFHFDSDINLLFKDVLESFRYELKEYIRKLNINDPKKYIVSIYQYIFQYIDLNPNLYKNLFLIAVLLSGTNYSGKDQVTPILEKLTKEINEKINFKDHWSRFTAVSIQYATTDDKNLKNHMKKDFFNKLDHVLA